MYLASKYRFTGAIGAPLLCGVLLAVLGNVRGGSGTDEERLMIYLENQTHPDVRPVEFANQTLRVRMYIAIQDYNMIEEEENFEIYTWFYLVWRDKNIQWSRDEFPGIRWTSLPLNKVWNPQLQLLNRRALDEALIPTGNMRTAFVNRNGWVWLAIRNKLTVPCSLDLTNFPYDAQTCYFNFSTPMYSSKEVDFTPSRYVWRWWMAKRKHSQWRMLRSRVSRKVVAAPAGREGSGDTYTVATAAISLKRVPTYYVYVYIIPVVIASLLTVTTFVLPPGNPQKITLGSGLLVLYSVMFLELGVVLPPFHASVPLIDKYYMAMYAILALSILFSTVTTNLTRRSEGVIKTPEAFRQFFIDCLGKVACLPYSPIEYKRSIPTGFANINVEGATPAPTPTPSTKPEEPKVGSDWLHIAAILDRLLLICYLVVTVVTTVAILKVLNTAS